MRSWNVESEEHHLVRFGVDLWVRGNRAVPALVPLGITLGLEVGDHHHGGGTALPASICLSRMENDGRLQKINTNGRSLSYAQGRSGDEGRKLCGKKTEFAALS